MRRECDAHEIALKSPWVRCIDCFCARRSHSALERWSRSRVQSPKTYSPAAARRVHPRTARSAPVAASRLTIPGSAPEAFRHLAEPRAQMPRAHRSVERVAPRWVEPGAAHRVVAALRVVAARLQVAAALRVAAVHPVEVARLRVVEALVASRPATERVARFKPHRPVATHRSARACARSIRTAAPTAGTRRAWPR